MASRGSKSLFDDIYRLQNTAPDDGIDPEDPEDGSKARLADTAYDEGENVGPSSLRKQAEIISDDPKYKGKRTSRKDLYSDGEEGEGQSSQDSGSDVAGDSEIGGFNEVDVSEDDADKSAVDDESSDEAEDDSSLNNDDDEDGVENEDDVKVLPETTSDDQKKGKAVVLQLGVWDDLIKSRIVLQKLVAACNRLPQPDVWSEFWANPSFRQEAKNVHSSVRKVMSALLDLQSVFSDEKKGEESGKTKPMSDSDEEITSESEVEEEKDDNRGQSKEIKLNGRALNDIEEDGSDVDTAVTHKDESWEGPNRNASTGRSGLKRKLNSENMEEVLAKKHADFQKFRNDTLSKWDEKTRLAHTKIKSKNFAAFEMSVLKQIEQVLVNRERLIRRIHQKRSDYRILGKPQGEDLRETGGEIVIEDNEDDVELKLKQRSKAEIAVDPEIIDDSDFYHLCLRDLIEMKQSEETDPVTASKQWLEIQRLRNKQKQKVDTKASKGRKIRYNVKEKLKNYMTPYDKSLWSDEQKDDLFKAMFGGKSSAENCGDTTRSGTKGQAESSIVLGI